MLAELVSLNILKIKLVKMLNSGAIYHKKTGILTDNLGNSLLHEGSDNFTRNAHSNNAESITVLYWNDNLDENAIADSIREFDEDWFNSAFTFDLSAEFLQQTLLESRRRLEAKQPNITDITPHQLTAGETTTITLTGNRLHAIREVCITDNPLIQFSIQQTSPKKLILEATVSPEHPPQTLAEIQLRSEEQSYSIHLPHTLEVVQPLTLPEFPEIEGFHAAIAQIIEGNYGTPEDFLYYLAQQKPHLWQNLPKGDILDGFVNNGILFEHQKSGAQHCHRVLKQFGVAICADSVGLGKTRLAAAVTKLFKEEQGQAKIAIIAAKKLHENWHREMTELGFRKSDYELYNKNLMSRTGTNFLDDFNRYGGPDLVLVDEAHEGIRNYNSRIHKTCLQIRAQDRENQRQRYFLLLTATPWNNRRDDIYNILSPFLTRPEGFRELNFPPELENWFNNRDIGIESFTDDTKIFRQVYRELFLQRTRKTLQNATPDLNLYAKRLAIWLPINFEPSTEQALDQIFTEFETNLYIPSADPIRYLKGSTEQRSLLGNQRRFFLQRAESSMYALRLTIKNFSQKIQLVKERLEKLTPDPEGLYQFLLWHYEFEEEENANFSDNEDFWEEEKLEEEEEEEEANAAKEEKRQQLRRSIELVIEELRNHPSRAEVIYNQIIDDCNSDITRLINIQKLLETEFVKDHKREQVTQKVRELVAQGQKVLLISTFSDTVLDYYRYMSQDETISTAGIGMAVGSSKRYYANGKPIQKFTPHNYHKAGQEVSGVNRLELFRMFAPEASIKELAERPSKDKQIHVLIGSETLSVGQNLQDADHLINIDVPYNPMTLEQRIGRIDRPKQHPVESLTIYYANSESQLLRQASRLKNLNKKLVGDIANEGQIRAISSLNELGKSIYGDTLFDDQILPDYIQFLESLVQVRQTEQDNFQENHYQRQDTNRDIYNQYEIQFSEELGKLVAKLGQDYQPKLINLGTKNDLNTPPQHLLVLAIDYFGPNGEPIPEHQEIIYWNDLTAEEDGYGQAIANGFNTPQWAEVFSLQSIIKQSQNIYQQLVTLKQERQADLEKPETIENIKITSERISQIQKRINAMSELPEGTSVKQVRKMLATLNQHKENTKIIKILKNYTEGDKSKVKDSQFVKSLDQEVNEISLLLYDTTKPVKCTIKLIAILLKL
jgi:superfamily II DNA or RNA helicase